jgi:hypothetical protein
MVKEPMWGGYLVFKIIIKFGYLKIKNSKNCLSLILLFLRDFKNCLDLGLRNSKRGNYEVEAGVRVCI